MKTSRVSKGYSLTFFYLENRKQNLCQNPISVCFALGKQLVFKVHAVRRKPATDFRFSRGQKTNDPLIHTFPKQKSDQTTYLSSAIALEETKKRSRNIVGCLVADFNRKKSGKYPCVF